MVEGGLNVGSAFADAAASVTGMFVEILPIALGVFALQWGAKKAINFFKGTTN